MLPPARPLPLLIHARQVLKPSSPPHPELANVLHPEPEEYRIQTSKQCVCEETAAVMAAWSNVCTLLPAGGGACVTSPEKPPDNELGEVVATAAYFEKLLKQHLSKVWSSVRVGRATSMWSVFSCLQ